MTSSLIYQCLNGRADFSYFYTCDHLKVIWRKYCWFFCAAAQIPKQIWRFWQVVIWRSLAVQGLKYSTLWQWGVNLFNHLKPERRGRTSGGGGADDLERYFHTWKLSKAWALLTSLRKKKTRGLVRRRTIPTERPPLVGEVSANF
jgi:hypothetical protein